MICFSREITLCLVSLSFFYLNFDEFQGPKKGTLRWSHFSLSLLKKIKSEMVPKLCFVYTRVQPIYRIFAGTVCKYYIVPVFGTNLVEFCKPCCFDFCLGLSQKCSCQDCIFALTRYQLRITKNFPEITLALIRCVSNLKFINIFRLSFAISFPV